MNSNSTSLPQDAQGESATPLRSYCGLAKDLDAHTTLEELDADIAAMKAQGESELGLVLLRRARHARPDLMRELLVREYQLAMACEHIEYALSLRESQDWLTHRGRNTQLLCATQLRLAANQISRIEVRLAKLMEVNTLSFAVELSDLRGERAEQYRATAALVQRVLRQRKTLPTDVRQLALSLALQEEATVNMPDPMPPLTQLLNTVPLGQLMRLFRSAFDQNQRLFQRFAAAWMEQDRPTATKLGAAGRLAMLHIAYAALPAAAYRQLAARLAEEHGVLPPPPWQPIAAVAHIAHAALAVPTVLQLRRDRPLRIALCLSGQMRGFKQAATTLPHLGLERHDVSVFIHTWRETGWRFPNPMNGNGVDRIFLHRPFAKAYVRAGFLYGAALMLEAYPRFFSALAVDSEVTESALRASYGPDAVIRIEDHHTPEFNGDTNHQRKMFTKVARCHELALAQDETYDLMIRLRPDKSFRPHPEAGAMFDWHAMAERSHNARALFMAGPIKINAALYAEDAFAIGAPEVMDVYARTLQTQQQAQAEAWAGFAQPLHAHSTLARALLYGGVTVDLLDDPRFRGSLVAERTFDSTALRALLALDIDGRIPTPMDQLLLSALD